MSAKIKNIDQLRDKVLEAFDQLSAGQIDTQEAGVIAKLSETIISGIKTQMDYARLTGSQPVLPFLGKCTAPIEGVVEKKLLKNK